MDRGSLDGWNKKIFGFGLDKWGRFRIVSVRNLEADFNASNFASTIDCVGLVNTTSPLDISNNSTLGIGRGSNGLDNFYMDTSKTLTMTAAQAAGSWDLLGGGNLTITGSSGNNENIRVKTTGTNSITLGAGADSVTVEGGTYTLIYAGTTSSTTETHALTFQNLIAGQSVTVDGLTLTASGAIAAADVATGFASLGAGVLFYGSQCASLELQSIVDELEFNFHIKDKEPKRDTKRDRTYLRNPVLCTTQNGESHLAWCYLYYSKTHPLQDIDLVDETQKNGVIVKYEKKTYDEYREIIRQRELVALG